MYEQQKYSNLCLPPTQLICAARVIDAYKAKEGSQRQLAERFKVSKSFVKRLICRYRDTGQATPLPHAGGAIAKIKVGDLPAVQQLVDEQPDTILKELCERACDSKWN